MVFCLYRECLPRVKLFNFLQTLYGAGKFPSRPKFHMGIPCMEHSARKFPAWNILQGNSLPEYYCIPLRKFQCGSKLYICKMWGISRGKGIWKKRKTDLAAKSGSMENLISWKIQTQKSLSIKTQKPSEEYLKVRLSQSRAIVHLFNYMNP